MLFSISVYCYYWTLLSSTTLLETGIKKWKKKDRNFVWVLKLFRAAESRCESDVDTGISNITLNITKKPWLGQAWYELLFSQLCQAMMGWELRVSFIFVDSNQTTECDSKTGPTLNYCGGALSPLYHAMLSPVHTLSQTRIVEVRMEIINYDTLQASALKLN